MILEFDPIKTSDSYIYTLKFRNLFEHSSFIREDHFFIYYKIIIFPYFS